MYRPENDGIDHINAYSKARTPLGRKLTNYAHTPFEHPLFGHFESMEGFWFWLASGKQYNRLRKLHGFAAHELGRVCLQDLTDTEYADDRFYEHIEIATKAKFRQNIELLEGLVNTGDLPIVHYYYDYKEIDVTKAKVNYLPQHQWQMEIIMQIRKNTQEWMKKKGLKTLKNVKLRKF